VSPVEREGAEDKLSVVARESERFTGGKDQGKQPQPSAQARPHLAKRVLNHPHRPSSLHGRTTLLDCPLDHHEAGTIVLGCELIAIVISVAVGHRSGTEAASFPLGS